MSKFLNVFKVSMKINFSFLSFRRKKEFNPYSVLIPLALLMGVIYIGINYIHLLNKAYDFLASTGNASYMIPVVFFISQVAIMFFGVFYLVSVFYYSRDYEALVYLPYKPSVIIGSKFLIVILYEYLTTLPILVPFLYIYGSKSHATYDYWIKSIWILILNPIIPIVLIALFVVAFMKGVQNRRHKDKWGVFAVLFMLVLLMGFNMSFQNNGFMNNFVSIEDRLPAYLETMFNYLPPIKWIHDGLFMSSVESIQSIGLLTIISLLSLFGFMKLSNLLFKKGLFIQQDSSHRRKRVGILVFKKRSQLYSQFLKEFRLFFRNPVYIINGMFGVVIAPLLTPFMFNVTGTSESVTQIRTYMVEPEFAQIATVLGIAVVVITSGVNIVASSSISREGPKIWICRLIPVDPFKQVLAKLLFSVFTSLIGIVINCLVFLFLFHFPLSRTLLILWIGILFSIPLAMTGLTIDLIRPKLNWVNYAEPVKQNLNVVVSIFISFGIIFLYGLGAKKALEMGYGEGIIYPILIFTLLALTYILYLIIRRCCLSLLDK